MVPPPSVEPAASGRAACRICQSKISRGELRVGTAYTSEFGESIKWHHAACMDLPKYVSTPDRLQGYALLTADQQATLQQLFSHKAATPIALGGSNSGPSSPAPRPSGGKASAGSTVASPTTRRPEQLAEQPPQATGVCKIEYAKAKKPAPCKSCSGPIRNGEARVGDAQPSPWYEGLQTRWLCMPCALRGQHITRFSQLAGWDRMGYDVSGEVRQGTGELLDEKRERELQQTMAPLEDLCEALCINLSFDQLKAGLLLNGVDPRAAGIETDSIALAHLLADGMLNGLCQDCPACACSSLHFAAGRIACLGSIEGLSKCPYRAAPAAVKRFRFALSDEMRASEWYAEWTGASGDAAGKGKGKGKGKKQPPPKPQIGSRVLSGLTLSEAKHSAGILLEPLPPPPVREPPEHGCPMLEVHRGFKQSGLYHKASVLIDEDGVTVYNAHLNQVDVATGVNRYYIVQALVVCAKFEVFCHWGAIGREEEEEWGATHLRENFKRYLHASKTDAISDFKKWYLKKTNWEFDARHAFRQTPGWYNSIELSARAPHVVGVLLSPSKRARGGGGVAPCSLEPAVSELVALLFDEDASLSTMEGSGLRCDTDFNVSALTPERIDKARAILERLSQLLRLPPAAPPVVVDLAADPPDEKPEPAGRGRRKRTKPGPAAPSVVESAAAAQARVEQEQQIWRAKLDALSNAFQQTIPARDPARIDSDEKLQERERMLDVLADVVLTQHLVADATAEATSAAAQLAAASGDVPLEPHPLDLQYAALSCKVRAVAPDDPVYLAVEAALRNTSEPLVRDGMCGFSHRTRDVIELAGLYELEREGEAERHAPFTSLGNRRLLWHGTGVGCAAAIVAQGLRISKHHAGRVGRGLYLADQSNKSGHYTLPSKGGEATMFLCEAALGRASVVHHDRAELTRAPHGFDSVVTESLTQPDPACDVELILGGRAARFATGPLQDKPPPQAAAAATSAPDAAGASAAGAGKKTARVHTAFSQTEYLVYDELQVRLRYLVKLRI